MRILSVFFLIHFSLLCKEINISGKIQDFNSLEPISDANIFLKNKIDYKKLEDYILFD